MQLDRVPFIALHKYTTHYYMGNVVEEFKSLVVYPVAHKNSRGAEELLVLNSES